MPSSGHPENTFPVCYNGNLLTEKDYFFFAEKFPEVDAVMLGRGVIANPGLIRQIRSGLKTDKKTLRAFHDEVLEEYRSLFGEDKNALFRMKEMWIYMIHLFTNHEKYAKKYARPKALQNTGVRQMHCFLNRSFCRTGRKNGICPSADLLWGRFRFIEKNFVQG